MIFKHFKIQIIIYLVLLSVGLFGLIYYAFIEVNYIRIFFLAVFVLTVLIALFYFINKTNRDLSFFLNAVMHDDFNLKYPESHKGASYNQLYEALTAINKKFIRQSQQEASEYQYIVTLIAQMQIGVLIYDDRNRIHLVNAAFKELIKKSELIDLDGLKAVNEELYQAIDKLQSKSKLTLKTVINEELHELSIAASEMRMKQRQYKIISVQDIKNELDMNEMLAWHKLIRVLTHEIMNSVSPISSLSASLKALVKTEGKQDVVHEGLEAIEQRSKSLLSFTDSYRKLTKIPIPKFEEISANGFFNNIIGLMKSLFEQKALQLKMEIEKDLNFKADPVLLEQVIINLLKNAVEASSAEDLITLACKSSDDRIQILIKDNGSGIPEEVQDHIFIPFYTTKTEGSGIGLSLSRQIINAHQGTLTFTTGDKGSCFKIEL